MKARLELVAPFASTWPQALTQYSSPSHVITALQTVLTVADEMCYHAADPSTDVHAACHLTS